MQMCQLCQVLEVSVFICQNYQIVNILQVLTFLYFQIFANAY